MTVQITTQALIAAGAHPTQAKAFADPLAAACALFWINTPARIGAFVGQVAVESAMFRELEENLHYSTPARLCDVWPSRFTSPAEASAFCGNPQALANRIYAGRLGNGDEASGDGWRYRGRGLIQITGRANYTAMEHVTGRPYVEQPELLAQPSDACLSAAAFWNLHGLNVFADAWNIEAITHSVNGPAMLQLALRRQISEGVSRALAATDQSTLATT